MKINTIIGKKDFIEYLRGKSATFILSLSSTKTDEIDGLSQAGIPGKLYLTPTLDAEFLAIEEVRSMPQIASTPNNVPTPALISRAIHKLAPFKNLEFLDLGVEVKPKIDYFKIFDFGINRSGDITKGAGIEAESIFQKGVEFGKNYKTNSDYVILAETIPSGTTTAYATAKALGYDVDNKFSSSYKDAPNTLKKEVVNRAINNLNSKELFDILAQVSDNMIIFNAGLILGFAYHKTPLILAGGTQMAAVLLTVNSILKEMKADFDSSFLALSTTKWVAKDRNSDIKSLLEMLDFEINAYYSDFDFSTSNHPALKLYDEGEAKEGVGAGGALVYGAINGIDKINIIKEIEKFLH